MRRVVSCAALLASLVLVGCGDAVTADARAVRDLCTKNGGEAPYCDCLTKTLQETISPEAFAVMARGEDAGDLGATLDVIGKANAACAKP